MEAILRGDPPAKARKILAQASTPHLWSLLERLSRVEGIVEAGDKLYETRGDATWEED